MKEFSFIRKLHLLIPLFFFINNAFSQVPYGFKDHNFVDNVSRFIPEMPSINTLIKEDKIRDSLGLLYRIGYMANTNININNNGVWSDSYNGDSIWGIRITSDVLTKGMKIYLSNCDLPDDAYFLLYSTDLSKTIGPYRKQDINSNGIIVTQSINSNSIIIEYHCSKYIYSQNVPFNISKIGNIYRINPEINYNYDNFPVCQLGLSGDCEVNINCEEGANWQSESKGICDIYVVAGLNIGMCSGSLINNSGGDNDPLILTAAHCASGFSIDDLDLWEFWFTFEYLDCEGNDLLLPTFHMTGCELLASTLDCGDNATDAFLVHLNSEIDPIYDVTYLGWDISSSIPSSGVCIHHPQGDVKKISTYLENPEVVTISLIDCNNFKTDAHFATGWSETDNGYGITEGGSSGSPLFNSEHLIVGTLTGSLTSADCDNPEDEISYYGRMSMHYENSPEPSGQLKEWLDPSNTGITRLGSKPIDPDIQILSATFPSEINLNQPINYSFTVRNNGQKPTSTFTITIVLHDPQTGADLLLESHFVNSIAANSQQLISGSTSINEEIQSGEYNIKIFADFSNQVVEFNEANNIYTLTVNIEQNTFESPYPPYINLTNPNNDVCHENCYIAWDAVDPDNNAVIYIYYDNNNSGNNGTCLNLNNPIYEDNSDYYMWNTINIPEGYYWIYATIDDGTTLNSDYSPGYIEINHPDPSTSFTYYSKHAEEDEGDGDLIIESGESFDLDIWIKNSSTTTQYNSVEAILTTSNTNVTINDNDSYYGDFEPLQSKKGNDDFNIQVDEGFSGYVEFQLNLTFEDETGHLFYQVIDIPSVHVYGDVSPDFEVVDALTLDNGSHCNNDGILQSGENSIDYKLQLHNIGSGNAYDVWVEATLPTEFESGSENADYPAIHTGDSEWPETDEYLILRRIPPNYVGTINGELTVYWGDEPFSQNIPFSFYVNPTPWLDYNPESSDFGILNLGDTAVIPVQIWNYGTSDLIVSQIENISLNPLNWIPDVTFPITINPDDTVTFNIKIKREIQTNINETFRIHSNNHTVKTHDIIISGTFYEPITQGSYIQQWSTNPLLNQGGEWVEAGNLDNDNLIDVVTFLDETLYIWEQSSVNSLNFTLKYNYTFSGSEVYIKSVKIGNCDGDNKTDIVILERDEGPQTKRIRVFETTGNDQYSQVWILNNTNAIYIEVGNCNADSYDEILVYSTSKVSVYNRSGIDAYSLYWNSGTTITDYGAGSMNAGYLTTGDTDQDNKKEIILSTDDEYVFIWEKTSSGSGFNLVHNPLVTFTPDPELEETYAKVVDIDNDNTKEIIFSGEGEGFEFSVFNPSSWTFEFHNSPGLYEDFTSPAIADLNGNGFSEVFMGTEYGTMYVFEYSEGSYFEIFATPDMEEGIGNIESIDLDNDGVKELILSMVDHFRVFKYIPPVLLPDLMVSNNNVTFSNTAPTDIDTVTITARIKNIGNSTATNISVEFFYNSISLSNRIGLATIPSLNAGTETIVSTQWIPNQSGSYNIYIVVDREDSIPELDTTNNSCYKSLYVLDNDTIPPSFTYHNHSEFWGDYDLQIEDNEIIQITWDLSDESGINNTYVIFNNNEFSNGGYYFNTYHANFAAPQPGIFPYEIHAIDDDNSPSHSILYDTLTVIQHAPHIISNYPVNNATNTGLTDSLVIEFDIPIQPASLNASSFLLYKNGSIPIQAASISYYSSNKKGIFEPGILESNTNYLVQVLSGNDGIQDLNNNYLEEDYFYSFTTETAPLTANFIPSDTTGAPGTTFGFTDISSGNPTSWLWLFGDGNFSNDQNPTHIYSVAGVYDVTLIVSNGVQYDTATYESLIQIIQPGLVNDLPSSITICQGSSVELTPTITGGTPPYSFTWSPSTYLSSSTIQNPLANPPFTITYHLSVTDANNNTSEDSIQVIVTSGGLEQQNSDLPPNKGINDISIVNENTVWAIGYNYSTNENLLEFTKTDNGGINWESGFITGYPGYAAKMICGISNTIAFVPIFTGTSGGGGKILKTTDGGINWNATPSTMFSSPNGFPNVVYFWNNNEGCCIGDPNDGYYEIYTTNDGGDTWYRVPQENIPDTIFGEASQAGYFSAVENSIWFGSNKGRIFKSSDKGLHWITIPAPDPLYNNYFNVQFRNELNAIIYIGSNIYRTNDGCNNWSLVNPTGQNYFRRIRFVNGSNQTWVCSGTTVTDEGFSYSIDDGSTWNLVTNTFNSKFTGTRIYSPSLGWAGGVSDVNGLGGMYKFTGWCTPQLIADFIANDTLICAGDSVIFTDITQQQITSRLWVFEGGTPATSTEIDPVVRYYLPGSYKVTLIVNLENTSDTIEIDDYITVASIPDLTVNALTPLVVCEESQLAFEVTYSNDVIECYWNYPGLLAPLNCSVNSINSAEVSMSGQFNWWVNSQFGCYSSVSKSVMVNPLPDIILPSFPVLCSNTSSYELSGALPENGTFTGDHITGNIFHPAEAGPGIHEISYLFNTSEYCLGSESTYMTVVGSPSVNLGPDIAVFQNTPVTILASTSGGNPPYNYQWSIGSQTDSSITLTFQLDTTVTVLVMDVNDCIAIDEIAITVNPLIYSTVEGYVTYKNTASTPMTNTNIKLYQNQVLKGESGTSALGYYQIDNIPEGFSTIPIGTTGKPWGGVNSSDALLIMKHYVGLLPLTGLKIKAADVNASNSINAQDALLVQKRFVSQINSFPAGDWCFDKTPFLINGNTTHNINSLCYGDVNGSYIPSQLAKMEPIAVSLESKVRINKNEINDIPVMVKNCNNVSAISVVLHTVSDNIEVIDASPGELLGAKESGYFLYNLINEEVRISWYSLTPLNLSDFTPIFSLSVKINNQQNTINSPYLNISSESNFANPEGNTIEGIKLVTPELVIEEGAFSFTCCYPNPVRTMTELNYSIPDDGFAQIFICNYLGQRIMSLKDESEVSGNHSIIFDSDLLNNGVYWIRAELRTKKELYVRCLPILVSH